MKKGFTIIELLVASLLLGMLVTILTMIFNQSSIAWRTGISGTTDLGQTRREIAQIRDEADNVIVANNEPHYLLGLWDSEGNLRKRAVDIGSESYTGSKKINVNDSTRPDSLSSSLNVNGEQRGSGSQKTYVVNVMSAGPDKTFETYDDIWSCPDEFE